MNWLHLIRSKLSAQIHVSQYLVIGPVIVVSFLGVYLVGEKVRQLVGAVQAISSSQPKQKAPEAIIEKKPVSSAELERYQDVLKRLHPSVTIEMSSESKGFTVSVADPKLYNEWVFALYSLQSYGKNVLWDVSRLCLKSCNGGVASAVVQGYTQSVRFNQGG